MMNAPHRIRLRRPWQYRLQGEHVLWSRRFGRPTGLETGDTVWIVAEGFSTEATASLNGRTLGPIVPAESETRFEITGALEPHNELGLEVAAVSPGGSTSPDSPPGVVSLEIVSGP